MRNAVPFPQALRILLFALGAVAVVAGLYTALTGTAGMPGDSSATPNVESELRFYSVFWFAFGVLALRAARVPEQEGLLIHGLAAFLFLGGLARGLGWVVEGKPDVQFLVLMALELVLPVAMVLAQRRISASRGLELRPPGR